VAPINNGVVATESLARSRTGRRDGKLPSAGPGQESRRVAEGGSIDFLPFGFEACRPGLSTVVNYALQQNLIPRKIDVTELFDDTTRALRPSTCRPRSRHRVAAI
jgi:4,5-dihydroxyphthalate decarboxylase